MLEIYVDIKLLHNILGNNVIKMNQLNYLILIYHKYPQPELYF